MDYIVLESSKSHLPQGDALLERHLDIDSNSFIVDTCLLRRVEGEPYTLIKLSFLLAPSLL